MDGNVCNATWPEAKDCWWGRQVEWSGVVVESRARKREKRMGGLRVTPYKCRKCSASTLVIVSIRVLNYSAIEQKHTDGSGRQSTLRRHMLVSKLLTDNSFFSMAAHIQHKALGWAVAVEQYM